MKRLVLPLALIAALSFLSRNVAATFTVYGAGNDSCSTWIEDRETESKWHQAAQWVQGYLSGSADNLNINPKETDSNAVLIWIDNYCQANPQHSVLEAARGLSAPPGVRVAGPGGTEGQLGSQSEMNRICRDTYSSKADSSFPVRWATTTDFREYSTYKGWNYHMVQVEEPVALRAENTIFTLDGRSYDQATGALSPTGKYRYPGAVIMTTTDAYFGRKNTMTKPLCVWGTPNPDFRD